LEFVPDPVNEIALLESKAVVINIVPQPFPFDDTAAASPIIPPDFNVIFLNLYMPLG